MATLLIGAAINLAVGIALSQLFPPPDINQEGPRLTELGFTSAAYGKFVNIVFGTDRVDGNIIDTTDPAIEEVVNQESVSSGGKGGGQETNVTTYTYFLTCRIAFCIEGADDLIRLWGDGKMIYDVTGTGQIVREGVSLIFYPGGVDQAQDPEEVARRGVDISAYRHLTTVKLDRMPLADYGNRIPNFTAEITFNSTLSTPVLNMDEPAGLDVPGSLTGADTSYMAFNPDRNELYSLKAGADSLWVADATSLDFKVELGTSSTTAEPAAGHDGFLYAQTGAANQGPLEKRDLDTGVSVGGFGGSGIGLLDTTTGYANVGQWHQLSTFIPLVGFKSTLFHLNLSFPVGGPPNGSVTDADLIPLPMGVSTPIIHIMTSADGLATGQTFLARGIPDHDRGRFFVFQDDDTLGEYRLVEYIPNFGFGVDGATLSGVTTRIVKQFTRGTFAAGDDFEGTGAPQGWALNRVNGDLILSNGTSMILYNPDDDLILAQRTGASGFEGQNNYYSGTLFAWGQSNATNGNIRVIDTRTLATIRDIATDDIPFPGGTGDGVIHETSVVWDDRVSAIYLSRVDSASLAVDPNRILKIFVNRVDGLGVPLSDVVTALSTTYQRQTMAGLVPADLDVTTLTADIVLGYTLNRKSTMKSALEPLRTRFQFDAIQSDWIMKFPKRGAASIVTIPEEDVGILKRGRTITDEPPVQETRDDDLSKPMRLGIRYKQRDADYQIDIEYDKRHLFPNPTMSSKTELTLDVPIVERPTAMKQLAQQQLLTAWNERVTYKSVLPWTYIALDPTDVFDLGVFGETAELRMGEVDLGAGWALEMTGVAQDVKSFSSTLAGSAGLGHISPNVPSSLPSRFFALDAPILSLEDLLVSPVSNSYAAISGFENSWPGATVMKSLDNIQYTPTGTVNSEAVVAKVLTVPGAWNYVEGDWPNRIQEVNEGGSMTITAIRRADFWVDTTETLMLSGANHIAVSGAGDNEVEIIGFIDVTDNLDNTFTLERLMRGRLGTEDIADGGMVVGDLVIGLSNATNVKEAAPIIRQHLSLSELDTETFFKAVTIGTLLEDAAPTSFTYTGRDLRPYSPVHVNGTPDGLGGIDIVWERRTRGPLAGEWLDGTGTVVLNESIEQYEVTLSVPGNLNFLTKVVDDATTVNVTEAELIAGGALPGGVTRQVWPDDGDFAGPMFSNGWVNVSGGGNWFTTSSAGGLSAPAASVNSTFLTQSTDNRDAFVRSDVDLITDLGMSLVDIPSGVARMSAWCGGGNSQSPSFDDLLSVYLEVLNEAGSVLASTNTGQFIPSTSWEQVGSIDTTSRPLQLPLNQAGGARQLRCRLRYNSEAFFTDDSGFDYIEIEVSTLPADLTIDVVQVSGSGKKSPIGTKTI